jgi:phosphosulfolactate phosphohydrolase-like enzyme
MHTRAEREVRIDSPVDAVQRQGVDAVVLIDVLLSSTTVVTSVAQGRRTVLAASVEEGRHRARALSNPILACEPGLLGTSEFDPRTGPSSLHSLPESERPLVLVSPAAHWLPSDEAAPAVYVGCLRNLSATVEMLVLHHRRVAVLGVGHGGQTRCEDQLVAGWIAGRLVQLGFAPSNLHTHREVDRWSRADLSVVALGRGAEYLRRLGLEADLDFVLSRVDDLEVACRHLGPEASAAWLAPVPAAAVSAGAH